MKRKKIFTGFFAMVIVVALTVTSAWAAELGAKDETIKLAINEWTGQHITTHVAGEILKRMGYKVKYVVAGYIPQFEAIPDGTITATLEIWESSIGEAFNKAVAKPEVDDLGSIGLIPIEGWWYPDYVAKLCPGLPNWKALKDCAKAFVTPESFPKGRLVDYPADWATNNDKRVEALGLDFKVIPSGSEGAIIAEIKSAISRKAPLLVMFWSPHWIHGTYKGDWVQWPKQEPACFEDPSWGLNPKAIYDCGFANAWMKKAAWAGMKDKWPAAYKVLSAYKLTNPEQEKMMARIDSKGEKLGKVVDEWVDQNEKVWRPWVNAALAN